MTCTMYYTTIIHKTDALGFWCNYLNARDRNPITPIAKRCRLFLTYFSMRSLSNRHFQLYFVERIIDSVSEYYYILYPYFIPPRRPRIMTVSVPGTIVSLTSTV